MGKCLSYRVFYQFIWIFGVISACFESACFKPVELMCDSEEVCNNGDCYRTTDSLIIDPKMGRSNQDCPKGFDNYKGYCLRVDLTRKKWHDAYKDSDNGELATFYRSQDDEISEEYLRMKLPDSKFGIWTSGKREQGTYYSLWFPSGLPIEDPYGKIIYERPHQPEHRSNSCLAILPNNYTNGQFIDCETEYNSLRIAYFTTGNIYMCQCYPGYSGVTCDSKASGHSVRNETIDPHGLECPQNTSISIEFADYKYRAGSFSYYTPTCAAPNTLSLLRYLCQGKNTCRLEPVLLKSYLSFPCYNINSTLTIQHSCLPNNETSCPSGTVQIDDEKSTNCAFVTQQRMSWNETMKFCQTHGGQLASFNNTSDLVRCSSYTGVTKSTTSFWIFGKLSDTIRPENNTAVECMKAIIDNQTNPINVKLTSDCSRNLTGICVFPPFHQNDTTKLSTLLQLTVKNAKGATVQNCSAQYYGGLTWPATIHGVTVDQPCPTGQNGYATWTCEENGEFNSLGPDFSYCTTSVSKDVAELSNNLDKGIHPDVVVTDLAVILETAETIASGDIVNAVYLLGKALIVQQQVMENMTNEEKEETMNTFTFGIVNTTGVVLNVDHLTPWFGLNLIERASIATKLLLEVEETGILYASVFTTATQILFEYNKTIQLFIETRNNTNHSELKMANIIIPSEAFSLASNPESGIIPIVATTYSTIGQVMPIGDHFLK